MSHTNQQNFSLCRASFFFLFNLVQIVFSLGDYRYEACKPTSCGNNLTNLISYPFWIHEEYCGYPEFKVTCKQGEPIINALGIDYIIKDINYTEQSFRVQNSVVLEKQSCPIPLKNYTFDKASPFQFGPNVYNLSFFYNCTKQFVIENFSWYSVDCDTSSEHYSLALFNVVPRNPTIVQKGVELCKSWVLAPVEVYKGNLSPSEILNYRVFMEEGFMLKYPIKKRCTECIASGGVCGFENEELKCFCVDQPYDKTCNHSKSISAKRSTGKKVQIGLVAGVGGCLITAIIVVFVIFRFRKIPSWKKGNSKNNDDQNLEVFFRNNESFAPKRFRYIEVNKMTNSFKEKLGEGGYGSVFKGQLQDGCLVAVKILLDKHKSTSNNGEEFLNEVASISRTSHINIVSLLGFCYEKDKRALIYEFMPNGSLDKFIYNKNILLESSLEWKILYEIAIGIARGLGYLHRGCSTRIIHFDIKPHNILLDEDFSPKIADFGLAKLCPGKESMVSMLDARGTAGYIAPEVFNRNFGEVSHKSDVYSYGMMILEMVGGRKNFDVKVGKDHSSQLYFPDWIYDRLNLEGRLGLQGITIEESEEVVAKKMIIVGLWCIQINPSSRPSMSKVWQMLEGSLEALQIPPKPFLYSPARSWRSETGSSTLIDSK